MKHCKVSIDWGALHSLAFNKASITPDQREQYELSGHNSTQMIIYNYFEPNPMPFDLASVKQQFSHLSHCSVAINYSPPGTYLPLHKDLYDRWMKVNSFYDRSRITRYIVMLNDNSPGQMLQIDDTIHSNWKSGACFSWQGECSHAIYNFSCVPRYALQITGVAQNVR